MTVGSDVIKRKNAKNGCFLVFPEKIGTNTGHNSLSSMLGVVHDVRDKDNKNHDVGPIMRYLKASKTGP